MQQRVSVLNVVKLAGAYIAFTIGSGFATGQEVLQFFTAYGTQGIVAVLVSMLIFCGIGALVMMKGHTLQLSTPTEIFRYYCGDLIGRLLEWFTVVFLFCVVSVMVAGTGAIFGEYFHIDPNIGKVFMAVLCVVTVWFGMRKIVDIIGAIGPVITVFTILIGVLTIMGHAWQIPVLNQAQEEILFALRATAGWWFGQYAFLDTAWFSGVLYAACMVLGGVPFLAGLGMSAHSRREAALSGIVGGFFLMLSVLVIMTAMLYYPQTIVTLEVPNLLLAERHASWLTFLFSLILLMGIYSTAAPMFWLVINRIEGCGISHRVMLLLTLVLGVIVFFGAQIGFGRLIGILYPFMGQIGVIMIPVIVIRSLMTRQ